jgi:hypothetical protein
MPDRAELLAEAHRRGLLPPAQKAAYEEAMKRGLVKSAPKKPVGMLEGIAGRFASAIPFNKDLAAGANAVIARPMDAARIVVGRGTGDPAAGMRFRQEFDANKQAMNQRDQQFEQEHPWIANTATGGGLGASIILPGPKGANLAVRPVTATTRAGQAAQVGGNMARSGVAAGTTAAMYGAGCVRWCGGRLGPGHPSPRRGHEAQA